MPRSATEEDIRRIYRDTIDTLYGFVSRRCDGDRDLAQDLAHETWLRAVQAWRADGVPDRPLAWLSTVAARLLSNHRRRPAGERLDDGAGSTLPAADDEPMQDRRERRSRVEQAMGRLPASQHRLLEAFHYERRSVAEIASALGLSARGVEGRLRRARQRLREMIESDPDKEERTR